VVLTGGTQTGVADTLTLIDTGTVAGTVINIAAAGVTGFEILNMGANAANYAITMTPTQLAQFTGTNVGDVNDVITMSTTGTVTGQPVLLRYALANGTGNIFNGHDSALSIRVSGGNAATTYNLGTRLDGNDTITGTAGADVLNITGSGTGSATVTAVETINFTTSATGQIFTTGATALPDTGIITAAASTVAVTIDASLLNLTTAGTLIDGPGNDTISVPTDDAERALLTLTLSSGGSDTVIFVDGGNVIGNNGVTINNFTTGVTAAADILDLRTGAATAYNSGPGQFTTLSTAGGVAMNSIVEINQALATTTSFATTDGGLAETAIAAAITTLSTSGGGGADEGTRTGFVILYGAGAQSGNAALYSVLYRGADLTAGNVATTDIIIELLGVVNGVVADSFVASNFV
jgi:hypothetical protein